MKLKYEDLKGNQQSMDIQSIDFLHRKDTALVIVSSSESYEIGINRIIQVKG
ncbi:MULTISPECIES: hypothetical protein [Bacillus]|uniref:hypothetical protein n=1 Tax=Bacillus TaxID=1386 RepID=UPI0015DFC902|nr:MULTISPECIES: hypothetical protein [Bacillus]MCP1161219.1 hypothetical protein [Bacillus infantis]